MNYTYVENIGRGGFGRVDKYIGEDGILYALKTFDPSPAIIADESTNIEKLKKRFIREYKTQKELNSEYIFPVIEANLELDQPFFVMPLAEKSFDKQIDEDRIASNVCLEALFDILNGLEYLHELGFTHRDLKPGNVLLLNGVWRLTDFGLVQINSSETTQLTSANSAWGSRPYSAPEQASNFKTVTHLADIYSFGCVVHDYYGTHPKFRVPFAKQTASGEAGVFIEKCTDDKPLKRFQSIALVRNALSKLKSNFHKPKTQATIDWINRIGTYNPLNDIWNPEDLNNLIIFIHTAELSDSTLIYQTLDAPIIEYLYHIDQADWNELVVGICEYVNENSFGFNFCDVLANRLYAIYKLGDIKIKAITAIATARLGSSHNRWYVMEHLMKMCGKTIDENLAKRISIEIKINDAEDCFNMCAGNLTRFSLEDFHPEIIETLKSE
jgi:serine/threonine protein kinase